MAKFTFTIQGTIESPSQPEAFYTLTKAVADLKVVEFLIVQVDEGHTGPTSRTPNTIPRT